MKKNKDIPIKPKSLKLKASPQKPTIKTVDLTKIFGRDPFAKFLKDQNVIAFLLYSIIKFSAAFPDKKFTDWLERKTLGELIQIFKGIAKPFKNKTFRIHHRKGLTVKELIRYLEEYNKERNKVIHKLLKIKFQTEKEVIALGKRVNRKGEIILPILEELWKGLLNQRLQKIEKLVKKTQGLVGKRSDNI